MTGALTDVANNALWPVVVDGFDAVDRYPVSPSIPMANWSKYSLDNCVKSSAVRNLEHRILGVQHATVGIFSVTGVHSNDVGPSVGEEHLADMGNTTCGRRRGVNHQVDVVGSVRGMSGENRLEFGNTSRSRGEGAP